MDLNIINKVKELSSVDPVVKAYMPMLNVVGNIINLIEKKRNKEQNCMNDIFLPVLRVVLSGPDPRITPDGFYPNVDIRVSFKGKDHSRGIQGTISPRIDWDPNRGIMDLLFHVIDMPLPAPEPCSRYCGIKLKSDMIIVRRLLYWGILVLVHIEKPLHLATYFRNVEEMRKLLQNGEPVNQLGTTGFTALHIAAMDGKREVLTTLIDAGALINAKDDAGITPLMIATLRNNVDAADLLIDHGADVAIMDANNSRPCDIAYYQGNVPVLRKLSERFLERLSPSSDIPAKRKLS